MKKSKRNITIFYIIRFLETCVFTTPIWAFFFTSFLNFSFGQALFIITLTGIISSIFEVPSGIRSDRFGRKKMYIIGISLILIEIFIWCITKNFWMFIFAAVVSGIGSAIVSGNLEALVHDDLEENKKEKDFKNIISNSYIAIFLGRAFSAAIAGYLFVKNPILPAFLSLISIEVLLLFSLFIKEPKQILSKHENNFSHFGETLTFLVKNKIIIIFIVILSLISGIGNIYYFTEQPYLKQIGFNIEYIGIIFAMGAIFSALGSFLFKKIIEKLKDKEVMNILLLLVFISSMLFIFFDKYLALVGFILLSIMFGFVMSFGNNYLIHKAPKSQKSTILSIFSLSITAGYSLFNISMSASVDNIGLGKVYFISIILIVSLFIFNLLTFNRYAEEDLT